MACIDEHDRYLAAVEAHGRDSEEARQAQSEYFECIRFMESIYAGRDSHSSSMDERLYQQWMRVMEAWEELFGKIKPRPPPDIQRTLEVRNQIFSDARIAMHFSNALTEAFKKSDIELKENEMFEFVINIREKPEYISELLSSQRTRGIPPINFITHSEIMGQLMRELERDRLKT
jgi:hypothetical protein